MLKSNFIRRRSCIYVLGICILLLLLSSCDKSSVFSGTLERSDSASSLEEEELAQYLTGIYSETKCSVPDDYRMMYNVIPFYDEEAGTVTTFSISREEVIDEDGLLLSNTYAWLYTFTLEGEAVATEQVMLPDDTYYVDGGAVTQDAVIFKTDATTTILHRVDRATGERTSTDIISQAPSFDENFFYMDSLSIDSDGMIYCTDRKTVFVLNPDLSLKLFLTFHPEYRRWQNGQMGTFG